MVVLTMVTYIFVRQETGIERDSLQKIQDLIAANEILAVGAAALLYTLALHAFRPLARTSWSDIWALRKNSAHLGPSLLHGVIIGAITLIATASGGYLSYLGFYLRVDEIALSSLTIFFFSAAVLMTALVEEYIFRACLEPVLSKRLSLGSTIAISTAMYVCTKAFLFDISAVVALNLALLNISFSLFARARGTFVASALLYFGLFTTMHFCFGLPFFGQDMPGILLLRPDSASSEPGTLGYVLSGGSWGPENGLIFSALLVIALYLPQLHSKKIS